MFRSLQDAEHVRKVVGPDPEAGVGLDNLTCRVQLRLRFTHVGLGNQNPVGVLAEAIFFGRLVGIKQSDSSDGGGAAFHYGAEIQVPVGNVDCQNSAGL